MGPLSLRVYLLGPFRVEVGGVPIPAKQWARQKTKLLVKLLAVQPHHQLHREQLMEALYPEQDPEQAASNLHRTLHLARRALEPELASASQSHFLTTDGQQVRLQAPDGVWIDLTAFEQAAAAAWGSAEVASYEAALALYTGDLLIEDLYEDWVTVRREQLRELHRSLLRKLARLYERAEQWEASIDRLKELLVADPVDEDAHRRLMRLYALTGRRGQALQQYRHCCDLLQRTLDAEPEAATVKLHAEIADSKLSPLPAWAADEVAVPLRQGGAESTASSETRTPFDEGTLPAAPQKALLSPRLAWIGGLCGLLLLVSALLWVRARSGAAIESLAVLPLVNVQSDAEIEYLSDGLTESIINSLSPLPHLRVKARSMVFRFKGKTIDARAAGRELGVQAVLTGRILQKDDRLIIHTELVDVNDGAQLWSAQYDRKLSDLVTAQNEIAWAIAEQLRLRLSNAEKQQLRKRPTENTEAWRCYLKGRYYLNKWTPGGAQKTLEQFEQALRLEPNFALAYAGLADVYALAPTEVAASKQEGMAKARDAVLKALLLDETLAEAHGSLALIKARFDWDLTGAEQEFKRALELNPNHSAAHQWHAYNLLHLGRPTEAIAAITKAQELDPTSLIATLEVGNVLFFARRNEEAIAQYRKALELDPNFMLAHMSLGLVHTHAGRHAEAIAELKQAFAASDNNLVVHARLGYSYAAAGQAAEARAVLAALQQRAEKEEISPYYVALIHFQLNDHDRALALFEQAYTQRDHHLLYLNLHPGLDRLRAHPQYAALLQRLPRR